MSWCKLGIFPQLTLQQHSSGYFDCSLVIDLDPPSSLLRAPSEFNLSNPYFFFMLRLYCPYSAGTEQGAFCSVSAASALSLLLTTASAFFPATLPCGNCLRCWDVFFNEHFSQGDAARLGYIPPNPKLISEITAPPTSTDYYNQKFVPNRNYQAEVRLFHYLIVCYYVFVGHSALHTNMYVTV